MTFNGKLNEDKDTQIFRGNSKVEIIKDGNVSKIITKINGKKISEITAKYIDIGDVLLIDPINNKVGIGTSRPSHTFTIGDDKCYIDNTGKIYFNEKWYSINGTKGAMGELKLNSLHDIVFLPGGSSENIFSMKYDLKNSTFEQVKNSIIFKIGQQALIKDVKTSDIHLYGQDAFPKSKTNQDGGDLYIHGGSKSKDGGKDGDVLINKGNILLNGNIGIGTDKPNAKLEIHDKGEVDNIAFTIFDETLKKEVFVIKKISSNGYSIFGSSFNTLLSYDSKGFNVYTSDNKAQFISVKGLFLGNKYEAVPNPCEILTAPNDDIILSAGGSEKARIKSGDNVSLELIGNIKLRNNNAITWSDSIKTNKIQMRGNDKTSTIQILTNGVVKYQVNDDGLKLQTGTPINEFSTDGTLGGNSDDAVPTEKAVKTYVDKILASILTTFLKK